MEHYGLQPDFSAGAMAQAREAHDNGHSIDRNVRDQRDLLWCSIDNDDSRDLDQLSVSAPSRDEHVRILVAIADVDATVSADSPVDEHARINTTSVYTIARIFPMLPQRFSTDLTSLAEGEDRLAVVVDMAVNEDGTVAKADIYRASVRNRARLTYNEVGAWLGGSGPVPARVASTRGLDEQLRVQDRAARAMRGLRHHRGALTLDTIQTHAIFDGDHLTGLHADEKNRAKELIEDFMIGANEASARFLEERGFASIRRVLKAPERWNLIVALAADVGARLPNAPDAAALETFLQERRAKDPTHFPDLSLSIVKMLGSGEYAVERPVPQGGAIPGHFGLAAHDYTHSTAPNRRFPDLITQRLLKAAMGGNEPPYRDEELGVIAGHCTAQEDNAAKVERQVRKSAAAMLLESRIGERFEAIVTGASAKGTWVRTLGTPVEGRVVQGANGLDVGDRVRVKLVHTDAERGFIDFARG
jgi:exoribonuclease-2